MVDPGAPELAGITPNPQNLDIVSWIINQDFRSIDNDGGFDDSGASFVVNPDTATKNYTGFEIQSAIWFFTNDDGSISRRVDGTQENVDEIIAAAQKFGDGFEAQEGDLLSFVFDPHTPTGATSELEQPFLVGLPFDDFAQDCLCAPDDLSIV